MSLKDNADVLFESGLLESQGMGCDADQPYREEIRRVIAELYRHLPAYRQRVAGKTYALVRDNLGVLTSCFHTNALNANALEVLHEHLLTLSRMFTRDRLRQDTSHLQIIETDGVKNSDSASER